MLSRTKYISVSMATLCWLVSPGLHAQTLSLQQAEHMALERDAMQENFAAQASAWREQAVAESALPDPRLKLGVVSLPTDTWRRDQEPMTQMQVGIQQMFPRGDSLAQRSAQADARAQAGDMRARDRAWQVRREVRQVWLDVYYREQAIALVRQNIAEFRQLEEVIKSQYAAGRQQQQDLLRAQLELGLLEDRLAELHTRADVARSQLARWVGEPAGTHTLPSNLPEFTAPPPLSDIQQRLAQHPALSIEAAQIRESEHGMALARQAYKPEWMLDLTYGFRDGNNPDGSERADFVSAMVVLDLPLFTGNLQDRQVAASRQRHQAALHAREERVRELQRDMMAEYANWQRLSQRHTSYIRELMPIARENQDAALHAYRSRRGDFNTLMRARITTLDTQLQALRLSIERLQSQARLRYLTGEAP